MSRRRLTAAAALTVCKVEYRLERINQVQVNPVIGLDFGRVLRTALRQDPDIILVGEMRDKETPPGLRP